MRRQLDIEPIDQTKKGTMAAFGRLDVSSDDEFYVSAPVKYRPEGGTCCTVLTSVSRTLSRPLSLLCANRARGRWCPVHPPFHTGNRKAG